MKEVTKVETPCFVMVSYDNVIVTQRTEELMAAISQRQFFHCEVAVLNEVEEASRLQYRNIMQIFMQIHS